MEGPKVSINIPTYNNEKTIGKTLESIESQSYKNIEVIIIDSNSKDRTLEIVKKYKKAKVYQYPGKLLGARALGVEKSKGKFVALIDSDQILEKTAIERAVKKIKEGYDMLVLYERSWKPKTFLEKLFDADRELTQKYWDDFIKPVEGVILPRFFKKEVLSKAFKNIPKEILPICGAHDHAIIYIETYKVSKKVGMVENAVFHMEPGRWGPLVKKTYRWGKTTKDLEKDPIYRDLIKSKKSMRKFKISSPGLSIKSNLLRVIRAVPYGAGYYFRK